MQRDIENLLNQIYQTNSKVVITAAGGGASAIAWIQSVPGSSRTFLKGLVPYHPDTLEAALGSTPDQSVSDEVALLLAERAQEEAVGLVGRQGRVLGIGCTATLATDRPKRGEHRGHIAVTDGNKATIHSLQLQKGLRTRAEEEEIVSRILIKTLAEASGVQPRLETGIDDGERINTTVLPPIPDWDAFMRGSEPALTIPKEGDPFIGTPETKGLLSGSFNPVHRGHIGMVDVATHSLGEDVVYEMPVVNADKPALSELQMRLRVVQFSGWATLVLTKAPTFAEKADTFPDTAFVVGIDTARRIVEPRFYGGTEDGVRQALEKFRDRGCYFLVAGRQEGDNFATLEDMAIPAGLEDLFEIIPESAFRADVSSSELRRGTAD